MVALPINHGAQQGSLAPPPVTCHHVHLHLACGASWNTLAEWRKTSARNQPSIILTWYPRRSYATYLSMNFCSRYGACTEWNVSCWDTLILLHNKIKRGTDIKTSATNNFKNLHDFFCSEISFKQLLPRSFPDALRVSSEILLCLSLTLLFDSVVITRLAILIILANIWNVPETAIVLHNEVMTSSLLTGCQILLEGGCLRDVRGDLDGTDTSHKVALT